VLLAAALAAPATPIGRLPLRDAAGRAALAAQLAPPAPALPRPEPVTVTVARLAAARPTAPALRAAGGDRVVSYGELEAAATALARRLVAGGAGPGLRIGIALPRGPDYLVAVLAVLKAGAAYVPLDPDYPPARLAYLVADAGLTTVIGAASLGAVGAGLADPTVAAPPAGDTALPPPDPDGVAYVLYTSGSTGEPKGVVVGHAGLARIAAAWRDTYQLRPGQVHLQMASAAFDVFTGDWVRALTSGGCLVFCPRDVLLDPPALLALLADASVDVAEFVPAVVRGLLAELEARAVPLPPLDLLIVGSDTWYGSEYARLRACAAPGTRVVNSYGLAESTIDSSWYEAPDGQLPAATEPVPIGRPFAGTRLYVCDDAGEPLPPGVPGELWIAGDGVARGYLGRAAETAARFRPDPLVPGARACRSGDRARLAADGHLVLLGRTDAQLKVRGIRVEPAEVEAALAADPRVAAAAVALRPGAGDEPLLAGYYVPRDAAVPPDPAALEAGLRARLPAALVPAVLVALPALPLTANGKLDRAALPAAPLPPPAGDRPATTATEAAVAAVAAELLGVPALAPGDDFFRRGGHSLLAARLVARLRARFGVELPLRAVFAAPTMAGLAAAVAAARTAPPGPPLRPRAGGGALPLSLPQQRLWFLHRLNPASSAWHISWAVELTGALARAALQAAVAAVVARHAALRTVFAGSEPDGDGDAEPLQRVQAELDVPVEWLAMPGLDAEGERALLAALARRPFDLGTGPLLRVTVLATAPERQVLVLVVHHIVADGWSLSVLADELAAAYAAALAGRAPEFPPLPVQYGDWAVWQREWLAGGELDRQLAYWRAALAGAPPFLDLGGGQPRPPLPAGRADWLVRPLPAAVTAGVDALALATGCTPYMVLLGLFAVVLGRYGGTDDVVVGTPVAGRPRPELEGLVGFFVNTLALRVSLAGSPTLGALLARVRGAVLDGLAHADLPFEQLVAALNPPRTLARPPVVQVLFVYHNQPPARLALPGLAATPALAAADAVKLDLTLHVAREGDGLVAAFGWDTDVLPAVRVARLAADFVALVEASVAAGVAAPLPAEAAPPAPRAVAVPAAPADPDRGDTAADPAVLAGLRVLWGELLGRATVADDDDFFALGGHSLLALRLLARIAARFGVELPPATVFARPTLRGLAAAIGPAAAPPPAPIPRQPRRGG
jgi:amino acid adenylation domain-containing protein